MIDSYRIVLTGSPLPGHDRQDVAPRLAALMRLSEAKAAALMSGKTTMVRRGLAMEQVPRYLAAIEKAGAEVRAELEPAPDLEPTPADEPAPVVEPQAAAVTADALSLVEKTMKCPACGAEQPEQTLCGACGADMSQAAAAPPQERRNPPTTETRAGTMADGDARGDAPAADHETPAPFSLSFDGRLGRLRYLAYTLAGYVPVILAAFLGALLSSSSQIPAFMILFMFAGGVITFVLMLRITVLRLHDFNRSGWTLLAIFVVSLVVAILFSRSAHGIIMAGNILLTLVFALWPGDTDANDYGPPPGPNTVWTTVGAAAVIVLGVIGLTGNHLTGKGHGITPSASARQIGK